MSHIDSYILCMGYDDEETKLGDLPSFGPSRNSYIAFQPIAGQAGGPYGIQGAVYGMGANYVGLDEVCKALRGVDWEEPGRVQLFYLGEDDDCWRMVDWREEEPCTDLIFACPGCSQPVCTCGVAYRQWTRDRIERLQLALDRALKDKERGYHRV